MASVVRNYADVFAPRIFIEADGELAADIAVDIVKFEFEDDEKKPNELKLTVNNKAGKYTDDPRFAEGVTFRVRWGYANDLSPIYAVVIAKAKPKYPGPGQVPTIEMVAWGLEHAMNRSARPKNWGKVSSSDVAREIAKRYSLKYDGEESNDARAAARVQPANVSDIQYLQSLASLINWDCYISGDTLFFHKKLLNARPELTFSYFNDATGTLMEFTPDVKMGKPGDNKKTGADAKVGFAVAAASVPFGGLVALGGFNALSNVLSRSGKVGIAPKKGVFANVSYNPFGKFGIPVGQSPIADPTPEKDKKTVQAHANAARQKIDMSAIEAGMKAIGTPRLQARKVIRIENVAKTYSGNWRVKNSKHSIDSSGYIVTAKLTRNALDKGKDKAKGPTNDGKGDPTAGINFLNVTDRSGKVTVAPKKAGDIPAASLFPALPAKFLVQHEK